MEEMGVTVTTERLREIGKVAWEGAGLCLGSLTAWQSSPDQGLGPKIPAESPQLSHRRQTSVIVSDRPARAATHMLHFLFQEGRLTQFLPQVSRLPSALTRLGKSLMIPTTHKTHFPPCSGQKKKTKTGLHAEADPKTSYEQRHFKVWQEAILQFIMTAFYIIAAGSSI